MSRIAPQDFQPIPIILARYLNIHGKIYPDDIAFLSLYILLLSNKHRPSSYNLRL